MFFMSEMLHKNVHFIGIGGISMSALAHILLARGINVSGSDRTQSTITDKLKNHGAQIYIGHSASNIKKYDLVVYTAAISSDNEELLCAKENGIKTLERADFLGELMKDYKMPISISGTHGKTTTTSMLSCVLLKANLNPTILVGGELPQIEGNYRIGTGNHLIFEGCEYVDSFLKFNPYAAIILNIEEDHLDYFSGIEQIKESFNKFMKKIPQNGFVVLNADDKNVKACSNDISCTKIFYGANGKYHAEEIIFNNKGYAEFDVYEDDNRLIRLSLNVTGMHNVSNALAVFATSKMLGISIQAIAEGIESFTGAKRRFELKGELNGAKIYDDYAHHPTEIIATLNSAAKIPHNKIWCVFQPHTYTRTKALLSDFANALSMADKIIITDIYAAREKNPGNISSMDLVKKINGAKYISNFEDITKEIKNNIQKGDIVLTIGAGTITNVSDMLLL